MDHHSERVVHETARYRITGVVTLARDGYRSRVSDVLNATERDVLPLTSVSVESLDGSARVSTYEFLAVHRNHIVFVAPVGPGAADCAEVDPTA